MDLDTDFVQPFGQRLVVNTRDFQIHAQIPGLLTGLPGQPVDQCGEVFGVVGEDLGLHFAVLTQLAQVPLALTNVDADV